MPLKLYVVQGNEVYCPHCKSYESKVIYIRHDDRNPIALRRRECLECNKRFFTVEALRDEEQSCEKTRSS